MTDRIEILPSRALWLAALFAAELVAVIVAFQVLASVECRETAIETACRGLRGVLVRALSLGVMLGLYLWAVKRARRDFLHMVETRSGGRGWAVAHAGGLITIFLPLAVIPDAALNAEFSRVFPVLVAGGSLMALGGMFWMAAPAVLGRWAGERWGVLLALGAVAMVLPDLAELIGPIWYWETLTRVTFMAVAFVIWLLAEAPVADPGAQIIGTNGFLVAVADSCSGVEGFALVTVFLGLYAMLFRDTLRMGRFWLVVWPVALFLSWVLNVVRIAVLVLIGAYASPELAVNGFHSFAGWLFFTVLALGILITADRIAWLHRRAPMPVRLSQDDTAARIVPFIVFMLSGVVAQTFWRDPMLAYPAQAAAMAVALWWFRRPIAALWARPSSLSLVAGVVIGLGWIWGSDGDGGAGQDALLALSQLGLTVWVVTRILGTVVLVPVIEELFFRGYVQARLDRGGHMMRGLSVLLSAGLFGMLHGRWLLAGVAGVILSLVYLHRGRLADAVAAHALANGIIAAVAVWRGDWWLI